MRNIWAEAECSGTPFVSRSIDAIQEQDREQKIARVTSDIARIGQEAMKRTVIPNEGGEYDLVKVTTNFVSHRANLIA